MSNEEGSLNYIRYANPGRYIHEFWPTRWCKGGIYLNEKDWNQL